VRSELGSHVSSQRSVKNRGTVATDKDKSYEGVSNLEKKVDWRKKNLIKIQIIWHVNRHPKDLNGIRSTESEENSPKKK